MRTIDEIKGKGLLFVEQSLPNKTLYEIYVFDDRIYNSSNLQGAMEYWTDVLSFYV